MKKQNLGPILVLLGALCFSIGGLFTKLLPWQAMSISSGRCILSSMVIGGFMLARKHKLQWNKTVLWGSLGMCGTVTLYVLANKMTTAANAIVLQYSAPIFIILFLWLFFRQKPARLDLVSCAVVFFGILLFFVDGLGAGGLAGNLLALLSGMCYAVVCMLGTFPGGDPLSSVFLGHLLSALIGLPSLVAERDFSPSALTCILLLGLFQLGLGYVLFTVGLERTPPVSASLISSVEPILNPILVMFFYGETLTPLAFFGAAAVILAVLCYNILKARQPQPEPPNP